MRGRWELSDAQWELIEPLLRPKRRTDGRGRPWQDTRAVLNGMLWVLGTGAQWRELPNKYPPYQTCHRRFQQWVREGKLERHLARTGRGIARARKIELEEAFIDATFTGAKKGASRSGPPNAARGRKSSLSPLITVFLSPLVSKVLRRTRANSSKRPRAQLPRHPPGAVDRRQSVRQRPPGPRSGRALWHRDDRTASRTAPGTRHRTAALRRYRSVGEWNDSSPGCTLSSLGDPLGVPHRELLRHGPSRLHANPAQVFMRPVLMVFRSPRSNYVDDHLCLPCSARCHLRGGQCA